MADFTALKTAIQNAIKQNGNEEITGNLLQDVLLAIVTTLGEGNINDLIAALNAESSARQLGDSTLQGGINTVTSAVTAINYAIANGCVYAGIATPTGTPATGRVFYLALTAGTYTNYGNKVVTQGINILKYNGSAWSLDVIASIDDAPTPSSQKLIKSGGVFDEVMKNGSAFDLSAYNGGATYADLNAALVALNALPAAYKRGGMSMKFVLSSDNKYVQYRLMSDTFNTNVANWQGVDAEVKNGSKNLIESGVVFAELNNESWEPVAKGNYITGYITTNGAVGESSQMRIYYYPCTKGDKFKIDRTGISSGTSAHNYAEYSTETSSEIGSSTCVVDSNAIPAGDSSVIVEITDSTVKLLGVSWRANMEFTLTKYSKSNKFEKIENEIQEINEEIGDINEGLGKRVSVTPQSFTDAEKKQARANLGFGNGDIDTTPTDNSHNPIESGGVFNALKPLNGGSIQIQAASAIQATCGGFSFTSKKIDPSPNPNDELLFFPISKGKKYTIHVASTRASFQVVYTNTLLIETPSSVVTMNENTSLLGYSQSGQELNYTIDSALDFDYVMVCHLKGSEVQFINVTESMDKRIDEANERIDELDEKVDGEKASISPASTITGDVKITAVGGKNYTGRTEVTVTHSVSSYHKTAFYPITSGKTYKITIPTVYNGSIVFGYAESVINESPSTETTVNGLCLESILGHTSTISDCEFTFVAQNYSYLFINYSSTENTPTVIEIDKLSVEDVTKIQHDSLSEHIINPRKVYGIYGNSSSFNSVNKIYIEGLLNDSFFEQQINNLSINKGQNVEITPTNYDVVLNKILSLKADNKDELLVLAPYLASQKTKAKNKAMRIMCIGDSLTDQGYPALTEFIFKSVNHEIGNVSALMVGNRIENREITMAGETYTCRGCNVGVAGHSATDFLRHAFHIAPTSTTSNSDSMSGNVGWCSLGLATKTRNGVPAQTAQTYTGTDAQKLAIISTCHGYYDADPSEDLWNYLVNTRHLTSFTYDGVNYTFGNSYSSADDATQVAAVKYILTSDNWAKWREPFYDYDTVQDSNGNYAFNIDAYLAKYKTLADDGVTRLVVGSTAGSLVTDVNAYDVCTPTHVVIIMSANDYSGAGVENASVVADAEAQMANLILSSINGVKVAVGSTRRYGALNPDGYSQFGNVGRFVININNMKYDLGVFKRLCELEDGGSNWDLLNVYQTQTVIGNTKPFIDTTNCDEKVVALENQGLHTDFKRYIDRAYQVAAWVIAK